VDDPTLDELADQLQQQRRAADKRVSDTILSGERAPSSRAHFKNGG
jgi:hypothetical protein